MFTIALPSTFDYVCIRATLSAHATSKKEEEKASVNP